MFDDYLNKFPKPGSPEVIKQLKISIVVTSILAAIFAFLVVNSEIKINAAPEQTYHAVVVEKTFKKLKDGGSRRCLVFELSNGEKKQFVNSKFFESINEGDAGMLTFKEADVWEPKNTLIISFEIE